MNWSLPKKLLAIGGGAGGAALLVGAGVGLAWLLQPVTEAFAAKVTKDAISDGFNTLNKDLYYLHKDLDNIHQDLAALHHDLQTTDLLQ
ncbi:hypothetical protein [Rhodoligotrophos defluvii]|uniref:hypothetical protein n=1 Tax=Rhodoligotrophos defluvii TaxID=2561934 RepID=UPI0010C9E001|nr:hypothetical protein [Rhodoligotrophos defluvii]